jgi:hypothetical protein
MAMVGGLRQLARLAMPGARGAISVRPLLFVRLGGHARPCPEYLKRAYVSARLVQATRTCALPPRSGACTFPSHGSWARPFAAAAGGNPKVFFDCSVGGKPVGRIVFELFDDVVPKVGSGV